MPGGPRADTDASRCQATRRVARTGQTMVRADTSGNAACSIDPATVQQGW